MTDWQTPFLTATPWMAWFFLGIGMPWALALLPRPDWRDFPMVVGVSMALGPIFGTTWLFILGTFFTFDFSIAFIGTVCWALVGATIAYRRRTQDSTNEPASEENSLRFPALKITLLVMMTLTLLAIAWDAAFWPFIRWDTLWTFGYNPKIFMLHQSIPNWVDYYPQLVPLTFTFADLSWGVHNDHAAKAAVPWFILSSGFASYLFGWRVFRSRLTGWVSAGLWMLLPSSAAWASSGDLEHPMALYFTLAVMFFVLAWQAEHHRTRYAVLSGLMLGGAMWTKPTSGAFVMGVGVVLVVVGLTAYRQKDWQPLRERFGLMVIVGLASVPIGGMWYVRNILYGHAWTNLPPSYWTDISQRSGMQLVWLYGIALFLAIYLALSTWRSTHQWKLTTLPLIGIFLLSIAILPTAISYPTEGWTNETTWAWINGFREPDRRLTLLEFALMAVGSGLLGWSARSSWQKLSLWMRQSIWLSVALITPFFIVYFWSFSYHYRLGLTVLPVILSFLAALVVYGLGSVLLQNQLRKTALVILTITLGLLSPVTASYHTLINTFDEDGVRTDRQKYSYANPALMQAVNKLEDFAKTDGNAPYHVLAPGENRLAFFFPTWTVNDALVADVTDLAGYDLFVEVFAQELWRLYEMLPNQLWAWMKMAYVYPRAVDGIPPNDGPFGETWPKVLVPIVEPFDDGTNRYEIFRTDAAAAFVDIQPEHPLDEVVFGGTMQLLGFDVSSDTLVGGETFRLKLYWKGTVSAPPINDYSVFVHFINPETGEIVDQRDGGLMFGLFPTRLLTPNMVLQDRRDWVVPNELPVGPVKLRIGVYVPDGPRLDVTVAGESVGDGLVINETFNIE